MLNRTELIYKLQKARPRQFFTLIIKRARPRQFFTLIIKRARPRQNFTLIIKYLLPLLTLAAVGIVGVSQLFIRTLI